jgi:hypothetical protein
VSKDGWRFDRRWELVLQLQLLLEFELERRDAVGAHRHLGDAAAAAAATRRRPHLDGRRRRRREGHRDTDIGAAESEGVEVAESAAARRRHRRRRADSTRLRRVKRRRRRVERRRPGGESTALRRDLDPHEILERALLVAALAVHN